LTSKLVQRKVQATFSADNEVLKKPKLKPPPASCNLLRAIVAKESGGGLFVAIW
jgi:hypothetical protein